VKIVNVMKYKQPPYLTDQRRVNFYCSIGDVKVSVHVIYKTLKSCHYIKTSKQTERKCNILQKQEILNYIIGQNKVTKQTISTLTMQILYIVFLNNFAFILK
jgi:hypothetical protein